MYLEDLIQDQGTEIESNAVEHKSRLDREDPLGWVKTVAGYANTEGGDFFLGVEDKTGKLIGFDKTEADKERNYFNNEVNQHITPVPRMKITFIPYQIRDKKRYIIRIRVDKSVVKPVIVKYHEIPSIFMRREGFTNGATYEEIISMSVQSSNKQYDSLYSEIRYSSNTFTDLQKFCMDHADGKKLNDKLLASLGFFDQNGCLANGALLFSDGYSGSNTLVKCNAFAGISRGSPHLVTSVSFSGNLTKSIEYMMEFVELRMNHSMFKLPDRRKNVDAYPARALFEGIVNAVAHRDYFLDGTQIQIDLFKDRLEITSPGSFYLQNPVDKTYNLSQLISKRRNELITSILVECNVMEAAGTGFEKIMEDYAGQDTFHRPYIFSKSDHFTLVLPDLTFSDGVCDDAADIIYEPIPDGSKYDRKILGYCYHTERSTKEISDFLQIQNSSYFRSQILLPLEKHGYLIRRKNGRTNMFRTNSEVVSAAE